MAVRCAFGCLPVRRHIGVIRLLLLLLRLRPLFHCLFVAGKGEEEGEDRLQPPIPQVLARNTLDSRHMLGPQDAQTRVDVVQLKKIMEFFRR